MKTIEAVFFDLDGLLADTEDVHYKSYNIVAEHLGIALSKKYMQSFYGIATSENILMIMKDFNIKHHSYEDILKLRYDSYHSLIKETPLSPMEGAEVCIEKIRTKGLKSGLVTSSMKDHALTVLKNISKHFNATGNLAGFFNVMVFGSEITHLKPEPDIYTEAARRLNIDPAKCAALEDSEAGVISAKRAGLFVVAVPNQHTNGQNFGMADLSTASLLDVAGMDFLN